MVPKTAPLPWVPTKSVACTRKLTTNPPGPVPVGVPLKVVDDPLAGERLSPGSVAAPNISHV